MRERGESVLAKSPTNDQSDRPQLTVLSDPDLVDEAAEAKRGEEASVCDRVRRQGRVQVDVDLVTPAETHGLEHHQLCRKHNDGLCTSAYD